MTPEDSGLVPDGVVSILNSALLELGCCATTRPPFLRCPGLIFDRIGLYLSIFDLPTQNTAFLPIATKLFTYGYKAYSVCVHRYFTKRETDIEIEIERERTRARMSG